MMRRANLSCLCFLKFLDAKHTFSYWKNAGFLWRTWYHHRNISVSRLDSYVSRVLRIVLQLDSCCSFLIESVSASFCWRPRNCNGQQPIYLQDPCCNPWRGSLDSEINSQSSQTNFLLQKNAGKLLGHK